MAFKVGRDCGSICGGLAICLESCLNGKGDSEFCSQFETKSESHNACLLGIGSKTEARDLTAIYDYHSLGLTAVLGFFALAGIVALVSISNICDSSRGAQSYNGRGQMAKVRFGTDLKDASMPESAGALRKSPSLMGSSGGAIQGKASSKVAQNSSGGLKGLFGGVDDIEAPPAERYDDDTLPPPPKQKFDVEQLKEDMISAIQTVKSNKQIMDDDKNAEADGEKENDDFKPKKYKSKKIKKSRSLTSDRSGPTEFDQETASDNGEPATEYTGDQIPDELQEALERFTEASRKSGLSLNSDDEGKDKSKINAKLKKKAKKKATEVNSKSEAISEPPTPRSQPPVDARPSSSYLRAVAERERPESIFRPSSEYMQHHVPTADGANNAAAAFSKGQFIVKAQSKTRAPATSNLAEIM